MNFIGTPNSGKISSAKSLLSVGCLLAALGMTGNQPSHAAPASDVMFIVDASNSMWGRVDGRPKIEIAKEVLLKTASELPQGTRTALISYGNRFDHKLKVCDDMELVGAYHTYSSSQFKEMLDYVTPKGQTPIAATLRESVSWVVDKDAQNPTIVLITDGVESCDGDPCAAAKKLAESGVDAKLHVVGYDLGPEQRAQLECIAANANGKYFEANDTEGLQIALQQVSQEATTPQPEPESKPVEVASVEPEPEVVREVFFEDEFEGDALSESWSMGNVDLDGYLIENGEMLMVSSAVQAFHNENFSNLATLLEKLPSGDWDMKIKAKFEMQTGVDSLWFGLYKDKDNYLAIQLWSQLKDFCKEISLRLQKNSAGKTTQFDQRVSGSSQCGWGVDDVEQVRQSIKSDGIVLTLSKRGRSYTAHAQLPGIQNGSEPVHFQTEKLTSLRVPGQPSFGIGIWKQLPGETLATIDRFEIIAVK